MPDINWSLGQTDPMGQQARAYSYADKIRQSAAQSQAGQQYAGGDISGAAGTLAQSGDIQGAQVLQDKQQGLQDRQQKSAEAAYEYIGKALPVFQKVAEAHANDPDGGAGALGQAFDQLAPELEQVTGHNTQALTQFRQGLVSDPKGTLERVAGMLPVKYQTVGRSVVRQQGDQVTPVYTAPQDPKPPIVHSFTVGDKTVEKQFNPETKQWDELSSGLRYKPASAGGGAAPTPVSLGDPDPTAPNITGQTGLSMNGFNYLVGNMGAMGRDKETRKAAAEEAGAFAKRSGTDVATIKSQYTALNNVLQNNLQRANQMEILEKEVGGTVQNLAPVADKLTTSNFKWTREGVQFVGGLQNDPNAQQYATYINQLRADLAGFNAVSGGKMTENGNARTDESDFRTAEKIISSGISSGGARGLATAIQETGKKNRAIVDDAIDGATQKVWGLFGVGKNYKPKNAHADLKKKYGLE